MDDHFFKYMISKKFTQDESGYFHRKVGNNWLNCDCVFDPYNSVNFYTIIVSSEDGDDIFRDKYYEFDEFKSIITRIVREERFKILLDDE